MTTISNGYTEVYVWLPKNEKGEFSNSAWGAIQEMKSFKIEGKGGRVGHVSMTVFPKNGNSQYMSYWPTDGDDSPARLIKKLDHDIYSEGTKPTVIIRLYNLKIPQMLQRFNFVKRRIGNLRWFISVNANEDVTIPGRKRGNCSSFVLSILKWGGLLHPSNAYGKSASLRGPKDSQFYQITRCQLGAILGDFVHKGLEFRNWKVSPKTVLHLVASAVEGVDKDKQETTLIMKDPNRVEQINENSGGCIVA